MILYIIEKNGGYLNNFKSSFTWPCGLKVKGHMERLFLNKQAKTYNGNGNETWLKQWKFS